MNIKNKYVKSAVEKTPDKVNKRAIIDVVLRVRFGNLFSINRAGFVIIWQ